MVKKNKDKMLFILNVNTVSIVGLIRNILYYLMLRAEFGPYEVLVM